MGDLYSIYNLVFEDMHVLSNPTCMSVVYNDLKRQKFGDNGAGTLLMMMYDTNKTKPINCFFQGALSISHDAMYYSCSFSDANDAKGYCMTSDGIVVGGESNGECIILVKPI